jgi:energy-coupling factor transport system ATP-binding protein
MIALEGVSCRLPQAATAALDAVDLHVAPGEVLLVVGPSGGGKTTLGGVINGVAANLRQAVVTGRTTVAGRDIAGLPLYAVGRHVGTVFQDCRAQFFMTHVAEELVFASRNFGQPDSRSLPRLEWIARLLGIGHLLARSVFELSSGERQLVAIAAVAVHGPEVVILDEPSSNLDIPGMRRLARLLAWLRDQGTTLVVIDHRLHHLGSLPDRIVHVDAGRLTLFTPEALHRLDAGACRDLGLRRLAPPARPSARPCLAPPCGGPVRLAMENVCFSRQGRAVLAGVSFEARPGEVIALAGRNGAGKTTLARILCGLAQPVRGAVRLDGAKTGKRTRQNRCAFVMQDPDYQLFTASVRQELRIGLGDCPAVAARLEQAAARLELTGLLDRHPGSLSMGEKQRTLIAAALVADRDVVVMDEPTSGMDGTRMRALAELVAELAARGRLVLVVTHDFEFIRTACTRLLLLAQGRLVRDCPAAEAVEDLLTADAAEEQGAYSCDVCWT